MESSIHKNIEEIRSRIAEAALRSGRDPGSIRLLAAVKMVPPQVIQEAIDAGVTLLGENRVQEAEAKIGELGHTVAWHMIGHLQTNKVKKALELFDAIESVDSDRLAREIESRAAQMDRVVDVLIEVNTSCEDSKFGVLPEQTIELVQKIAFLPHIGIRGLMTMGRWVPDPADVRPCYRMLRELRDRIVELGIEGVSMDELSMGMSHDYEVAIEEGATEVRLGTALFGSRHG
jgi:pyridoxal phosphate enzyme (YggS family)